jgi:hypothetical protein
MNIQSASVEATFDVAEGRDQIAYARRQVAEYLRYKATRSRIAEVVHRETGVEAVQVDEAGVEPFD